MALQMKFRVRGADDLLRSLAGFKQSLVNRVVRPALRPVASIVLKAARAKLVPGHGYDTGSLKRSLGVKTGVTRRQRAAYAVVGPRTGYKKDRKTRQVTKTPYGMAAERRGDKQAHFYAVLVEKGTAPHALGKGGRMHPGARPKPFMRPAWDENKARISTLFRQKLKENLLKEAQRQLGRKNFAAARTLGRAA